MILKFDCEKLGEPMAKYDAGSPAKAFYNLYEIDENFFNEE
jgi:hypothetical protein